MKLVEGVGVDVVQAEQTGAHQLRLIFSDGTERIVDFGPFLDSSAHPAIRSFLEQDRFASFRVEQGDLLWGDYDLCFPVADLYETVPESAKRAWHLGPPRAF
ncbi:MAG: DUF2442 domain-containing protein [Thermoanaerobaculia bacterium]